MTRLRQWYRRLWPTVRVRNPVSFVQPACDCQPILVCRKQYSCSSYLWTGACLLCWFQTRCIPRLSCVRCDTSVWCYNPSIVVDSDWGDILSKTRHLQISACKEKGYALFTKIVVWMRAVHGTVAAVNRLWMVWDSCFLLLVVSGGPLLTAAVLSVFYVHRVMLWWQFGLHWFVQVCGQWGISP